MSAKLCFPFFHITVNWLWETRSRTQQKRMSMALDRRCLTVLLEMLAVVELLVEREVAF
jgi:hypothetical protein